MEVEIALEIGCSYDASSAASLATEALPAFFLAIRGAEISDTTQTSTLSLCKEDVLFNINVTSEAVSKY
jgi:hypothetical protein